MFGKLKDFINNVTVKENELFLKNNGEGVKMNNKMKEVAKILGKKLEEEFEIEGVNSGKYKFTEKGLCFTYKSNEPSWRISAMTLGKLLMGELKIKWKPENREMCYFVFSRYPKPQRLVYYPISTQDTLMFKRGLITRTEQEAIQKMKDMGWWEE